MMRLKDLLIESEKYAEALLNKKSVVPKDFPDKQGVYLIRDSGGKIIYVGKATKLHRRINSDHISGDLDMGTSTFRRKLAKKFPNLVPGKQMREWITKNCLFSFVEIENSDLCHLVEALTIMVVRNGNPELLNS